MMRETMDCFQCDVSHCTSLINQKNVQHKKDLANNNSDQIDEQDNEMKSSCGYNVPYFSQQSTATNNSKMKKGIYLVYF